MLVLTHTGVLSCVQSDKKLAAEARLAGLMEHAGGLMVKGNYDGVRDQNHVEHERCLAFLYDMSSLLLCIRLFATTNTARPVPLCSAVLCNCFRTFRWPLHSLSI